MEAKTDSKPHSVCIPFPAQGHINPMLKLAKLLHSRGFFVTFVNTEYIHHRLLNSGGGPTALPDFRFATIPDGLPPSETEDSTRDIPSLCDSTSKNCLEPFCNLLAKLNSSGEGDVPPVSCIVSDVVMSFTLKAAEAFGLPAVLFWTGPFLEIQGPKAKFKEAATAFVAFPQNRAWFWMASACGFLACAQYKYLVEKGYTLVKEITNEYLETRVDWVRGMRDMRLRDFPTFIRTTDPQDMMLNFIIQELDAAQKADALIINTFDALEHDALHALSSTYAPRIYDIGPLNNMTDLNAAGGTASLWNEELSCIEWLDGKKPGSVLYVNFGSIAVATRHQLTEFAWGLANSGEAFLWIIRPDALVAAGDSSSSAVLPPEFAAEVRDRGLVIGWAPQEKVLKHPAVGGFLTHCGWNSTVESIVNGGLPLICWPFFADQQTNCRYSCVEWGIGVEIDNDVKREEVAAAVTEVMDGDKGRKMREKALELKRKAEEAAAPGGSSYVNLDKLIDEVLLR